MPPRIRKLSDQDRQIWATYARHVRALAGKQVQEPAPPPPDPAKPKPTANAPATPPPPTPPPKPLRAPLPILNTGHQPPGLDNATWNRFRGGKLAPVRTIDLHGKTAQAAYIALERFLHAAHADRLRCVEIITGRGSGERGGVIRRELPLWLNLPGLRGLILATAHPHAVNTGSTRVLLRRPK